MTLRQMRRRGGTAWGVTAWQSERVAVVQRGDNRSGHRLRRDHQAGQSEPIRCRYVQPQTLPAVNLPSGKKLWEHPVAGKLIAPPPL